MILCDGTTNASIRVQEVVYVFFVDPDTMEPTPTFFECLGFEELPLKDALKDCIAPVDESLMHLLSL